MGHLFSRAIKRFTQCNGGRNQLASGSGSHEQQATTDAGQRDQDLGRQTVQSIPVGQSIDSAEYAAFKTSSSSFDGKDAEDLSPAVTASQGQTTVGADVNVNDDKENENTTRQQRQVDQDDLLATNDQNKPEVEEAVIKIQALVRGHLTRKALKDAQQQAAVVPPNALGQSQFDEESLRNPPNAVFSNASPANSTNLPNSNNNNQHQQSNKPSNNRVPPLESIAEDVESANQSATNSTRGKRSPLSPLNQSSGSASDSTGEPHSTSPSNEAHVSIELQYDAPASASIDIMDHTSKPMPGIATVLHHMDPADNTPTASQHRQQVHNRQALPDAFDLPNLVTFESPVSEQHQMNASSLPSSPPHINLAATTNSHSIDSAEAAAIRIQSAFRGYHTRKHSPYRRRSPANATSPLARPINQVNGNESNGQPKRSTLRQQDATIVDEDDDEGVEGCERLAGLTDARGQSGESQSCRLTNVERDNEENRQSRQRHRADEAATAISDSAEQTSVKNIAALSIDEISNTDDQSTVKELRSDESRGRQTSRADDQTVLTGTTNKAAVLTSAETDEHLEPSEQPDEGWTNKLSIGDGGAGARWSTSVDTDSSNLGAALSLNEDLSEGISQASQGREALQRLPQQRESVGAAIEAVDESVGDFGFVLDGEPTSLSKDSTSQQIDELNKATSQLEAALDETTDKEADYYGDQLAENLADKILEDETEENLNELESDDIERRHPTGLISQDSTKTPASSELEQPVLAASESLDQEAQEPLDRNQRLDVVSPDEAIGSGESSPVPVVLQDGNSSDDNQDSDQDQESQHQQEQGTTKTDNNPQGGNGGKSKKRNRNKKKGKK